VACVKQIVEQIRDVALLELKKFIGLVVVRGVMGRNSGVKILWGK